MSILLPKLIENDIKYYLNIDKIYRVGGDLACGFIQTSKMEIKWKFDTEQNCCETWEIESSMGHINQQLQVYKGMSSKFEWVKLLDETEENKYGDIKGSYKLYISPQHWIQFSNTHNGYYSHELDVKITHNSKTTHWNVYI